MTTSRPRVSINDLEHELRMLFGAAKIQNFLTSNLPGNVENYFKDSTYIHARALYNFFTKAVPGNDDSITQFGEPIISSALFPTPWKAALNVNVMHIAASRSDLHNIKGGKHINECVQDFATDIENMWLHWISITRSNSLRTQLEESLDRARKDSSNDLDSVVAKFHESE